MGGGSGHSLPEGHALDPLHAGGDYFIGFLFDPAGDIGVGWSARGWVVFETTVLRRVMRRGDDYTVSQSAFATFVVIQNSQRNSRRGGEAKFLVDHHIDFIGGQHFQSAGKGRLGKSMGIDAEIKGAVDAVFLAIETNGLGDCQYVFFVESSVERRTAVPGSTKSDSFRRLRDVGLVGVIGGYQTGNIDEHFVGGRFTS
ncbi:MAG: hypothetical protein BWY75_03365 [bacterium ADurb.Bin425]|nr:MAG: hypothetical protein BWY75_03365 [bacterium ADurb.Bin425]